MRLLHTSDWHIGRTFHGHSTVEHLRLVLAALVDTVREKNVDVVLVPGDVFDSATPAADYYGVLTGALRRLRESGATVVVTSGNHDSAARLGFMSEFAGLAGIHVITRPEQHDQPIMLADEHGPVAVYGIPFLEPALVRHLYPEAELRSHAQVLDFAMTRIRADAAARAGAPEAHAGAPEARSGAPAEAAASGAASGALRTVVLAHVFAADIASPGVRAAAEHEVELHAGEPSRAAADDPVHAHDQTPGLERDITAGGFDLVPLGVFDGVDYAALGHIHGRATLSEHVRYCGAPLHYSFSEADKPRGAWLVELGADGLGEVEWVSLPVPRRLTVLTATLDELLADPRYTENERDWVSAILTDQARPLDAMRKLQQRYPWCATLEHRPAFVAEGTATTYSERVKSKPDHEIVGGFLEHVRNGVGPSAAERSVISEVIAEQQAAEAGAVTKFSAVTALSAVTTFSA